MHCSSRMLTWLVIQAVWVLLPFSGIAAEETAASPLTAVQIAEKHGSAVVEVMGLDAKKQSAILGTGFLVTASGVFVTNYHVIGGIYPAQVRLANGDVYDSISVVDTDERKDIAVLKVKGFDLPFVPLGNSDSVKIGQEVVVIGNPRGLEGTVTDGLVSAVRDTGAGYKVFQISAPISPGSSGSPVFEKTGQVVGVATATIKDGQNLNFAVPINYVRGMISEKEKMSLEEFSKSAKPKLIDTSTGMAKLDADEWGKRIAPIMRKVFEGLDYGQFGSRETLEPHLKRFRPDKFAISPFVYVGRQKLLDAADELESFRPADAELSGCHEDLLRAARRFAEAAGKQLDLLKTVPSKGWADYNSGIGEVSALVSAAAEGSSDDKNLVRVYEKHCPKQAAVLPCWMRSSAHPEDLPTVRLGFQSFVSRDDVSVLDVEKDGPADKAKIKPGDVIVGVENGPRFKTCEDWNAFMKTKKPGDEVKFEILRAGKTLLLKAKLAARTP